MKSFSVKTFVPGLVCLLLVFSQFALAAESSDKLESIRKAMRQSTQGFVDNALVVRMELRNAKGKSSSRQFKIKTLEGKNDNPKMLLVFTSPRDLKGTALLTHVHSERDNDQWMYFPSSKRTKKIAANGRSGAFLGSEFSFEDIAGFDLDDYQSKWLREQKIDSQLCDVIENTPIRKSSYSKIIAFIDQSKHVPIKVDFYDKRKKLLKTLSNTQFKQYKGKYWLAHNVVMKNHKSGKATHLNIEKASFDIGLKDRDFSKNVLTRLR